MLSAAVRTRTFEWKTQDVCKQIYVQLLGHRSWLHSINTQTQRKDMRVLCLEYAWKTVRIRSNQEFLNLGSCSFSRNDGFVKNMTPKTQRRKMYAAIECESVEISHFLPVRFENVPPQKWTLISWTSPRCSIHVIRKCKAARARWRKTYKSLPLTFSVVSLVFHGSTSFFTVNMLCFLSTFNSMGFF